MVRTNRRGHWALHPSKCCAEIDWKRKRSVQNYVENIQYECMQKKNFYKIRRDKLGSVNKKEIPFANISNFDFFHFLIILMICLTFIT